MSKASVREVAPCQHNDPNRCPHAETMNKMKADKIQMLHYLILPIVFLLVSTAVTALGVYLTHLYFLYEHGELIDEGPEDKVNLVDLPYLFWGPIAFAAGSTGFISSLIYITYKTRKWSKGLAAPIKGHFDQYKKRRDVKLLKQKNRREQRAAEAAKTEQPTAA